MKKLLKYGLTALFGLVVAAALCFSRGVLEKTKITDVLHLLCDGFFVPAVLMLGISGLAFVSNNGIFYVLGYAFKTLLSVHNWSQKNKFGERQTYGDYVEEKRAKGTKFPTEFLVVGLVFLAISIGLMAAFNHFYYA